MKKRDRRRRKKKRERETENSKSTRNREEPSWFSLVTRAFFHFGGGGGGEGRSDNSVFVFAGLPAPWKPGGGEEEEEEERKSARRFAGKARKLCSEQSTMVPLWRGDTLCFSIIFNYFLKAATAFDAHPPSPLLTPPPPPSHPIDPSRFSTSNLKNTTSTTVPPPLHHRRLLPPPPPLCFSLFSVLLSFLPSATGCVTDDRTKRRIREREGRGEKGDLRF